MKASICSVAVLMGVMGMVTDAVATPENIPTPLTHG